MENACASFRKHETSKFHIEAVEGITKPQHNVDEMLSQVHSNQKKRNAHMLMKIMQNVWFLSRHGLAVRGYNDNESSFTQLLKLRSVDQTDIYDWLAKNGDDKYTSPEVQNEILTLMSQVILCVIARQFQQAEFFTIMTNECVDGTNKEQLVICFRYVNENLDVHELGSTNVQTY